MPFNLIIRTDAGADLGTDPATRALALACAARDAGQLPHVVGRFADIPWFAERLQQENIPLTELDDAPQSRATPEKLLHDIRLGGDPPPGESWVALDGGHFTSDCQQALMRAGYWLLVIDEHCNRAYCCDLLLNANLGAETMPYIGQIGYMLLGPKYALLPEEFAAARAAPPRRRKQADGILVALGRENSPERLGEIARGMLHPGMAGYPVRIFSENLPEQHVRQSFEGCLASVEVFSDPAKMIGLVQSAVLSVVHGDLCWGLCSLGAPFLTVEAPQTHRNYISNALTEKGLAEPYSPQAFQRLLFDAAARERMSKGLRELADAQGAARVVRGLEVCLENPLAAAEA